MGVDYTRLAIAVVTHESHRTVQKTIAGVLKSVPDFRAFYLIGNHPVDKETIGNEFLATEDRRRHFIPTGRIPEHPGRLSESWNLAMQWAFRDPKVEWLWCMHDDLEILPGWPELLEKRAANLYVAPFGDMCFLFNRKVFEQVGWFDERYLQIGFQDNDWIARVAWKFGEANVVIEYNFQFGNQDVNWIKVNHIDLSKFWKPQQRFTDRKGIGYDWYMNRWGNCWVANQLDWNKAIANGPSVPDIDWYPWFLANTKGEDQ